MTDKIKVMYVEDEPSLARIVSETLTLKGFDVNHIQDGKRAVGVFGSYLPDICVLDIMLPGMDGYAIAGIFRQLRPEIPILFLSAKDETRDVIMGFESGGNDYLKKPFSMEELIVRIHNLVQLTSERALQEEGNCTYDLGNYLFEPRKYELRIDQRSIQLSHRESGILEILCRSMNDTCPRKDILMALWGDDSYFNSRSLDVYINKLRKLFSDEEAISIVTLKGVGYLFKVEDD